MSIIRSFIILVAFYILSGCSAYSYKTKTVSPRSSYAATIERAKEDKRYLILYSGINIYSITSVDVDTSKQQFTVQLDKVDSLRLVHLHGAGKRYKPQNGGSPSELLVYMIDSTSYTLDEPHTLLMSKVAKIELVE